MTLGKYSLKMDWKNCVVLKWEPSLWKYSVFLSVLILTLILSMYRIGALVLFL